MPCWGDLDPTREAQAEVLAFLDQFLSDHAGISVHYIGYAHEPMLRILHRHLGIKFSVMDVPDRYSTGMSFFWEEEDGEFPGPARPEWLRGVPFYQEGAPEADLQIQDIRWRDSGQLAALVARHPTYFLLIDEARFGAHVPEYSWTYGLHYSFGTLQFPNA